jgi:RNA ligase (TIGR02306 family)
MNFRKLVTVRQIDSVGPIPDADAIEVVTVGGWKVVSKKGEFKAGDLCVYFEIDSFLPKGDHRFEFLMAGGVRTFEGAEGHVLRTVRLRGQLSQGLVLPIKSFVDDFVDNFVGPIREGQELRELFSPGADLTDFLNIKKWEPTIPPNMAGQVKGAFPSFIIKTDQERCQNLVEEIFVTNKDARYEVSMKMDGASVTDYTNLGESGVCSRNLELKVNEENKDNTLVKMFVESGLQRCFSEMDPSVCLAIQGEMMGPGIQDNPEKFTKPKFFVFDIQNIVTREMLTSIERRSVLDDLAAHGCTLEHVPILHVGVTLAELGITNCDELLKFAEGKSLVGPIREGLVFKRMDGKFSFKAISNEFLRKKKG